MIEAPDSALMRLQEINADTLEIADKMRYQVLYTQACDKNYVHLVLDSTMLQAVSYYDSKDASAIQRMKAHYYLGRIYQDNLNMAPAMKEYLIANKIATDLKDDEFILLITVNMGNVLRNQSLFKEAGYYYKTAEEIAEKHESNSVLFSILLNRAKIGLMLGEDYYQQVEIKLLRANEISKELSARLQSRIKERLANFYVETGKYDQSIYWAHLYISTAYGNHRDFGTIYRQLGEAYFKKNDIDSASFYFNKAINVKSPYTRRSSFDRLTEIARQKGLYKDALRYNDSTQYYNSIIESLKTTKEVIVDLKEFIHNVEIEQYQAKSNRNLIWLALLIISLSVIIFALLYYYRQIKKQTLVYRHKMNEIQHKYVIANHEIDNLNNLINECENDKLNVALYKKQILEIKRGKKELFAKILPSLSSYRKLQTLLLKPDKLKVSEDNISSKLWLDIEYELNCAADGFTNRLLVKYPELKKADIQYCCLLKFNFSQKETALLLGRTPRMMYNRRNHIFSLIDNDEYSKLEDFIESF